jgi:hypothetical protein
MNAEHVETTIRVFCTVYKIAKQNRLFTDLPVDIELQELNGLNMGRVLHSNFSCANIVDHIAKEMNKIAQYIIQHNIKISVMVDESTTVSHKSVLVICLRCTLNEDDPPLLFIWDLVELENTTAAGIKDNCLSNFRSHEMDEKFLQECLISFACDGAAVMFGRKTGVATEMKREFPNLVVWHCCSHHLELAVSDMRNEVQGINHFHSYFDKLYSLYSMSPKSQRELTEWRLHKSKAEDDWKNIHNKVGCI